MPQMEFKIVELKMPVKTEATERKQGEKENKLEEQNHT